MNVWPIGCGSRVGGYSAADALGVYSASRLMAQIMKRIRYENTTLIRGYFNESLTPGLAAERGEPNSFMSRSRRDW